MFLAKILQNCLHKEYPVISSSKSNMATPIEEGQTEGKATLLFRSSTRNMSHSTPTRELDQKVKKHQ